MIKKTVTYENFDGGTDTVDLYFHLNKAELLDLEIANDESFSKKLVDISKSQDVKDVLGVFKTIILAAYGQRTSEGRFIKNAKIREEFDGSEPYSELLFSLLSNPSDAAKFVGGLMPKDLMDKALKEHGVDFENPESVAEFVKKTSEDDISDKPTELRVVDEPKTNISEKDMREMSHEELVALLTAKK